MILDAALEQGLRKRPVRHAPGRRQQGRTAGDLHADVVRLHRHGLVHLGQRLDCQFHASGPVTALKRPAGFKEQARAMLHQCVGMGLLARISSHVFIRRASAA